MANAAPIARKTPSHILERVRKYRTDNRDQVNARRRKNAAEKRAAGLEQSVTDARTKLGREPRTLKEWFSTQSQFANWAQLASEVGVSRRTVLDWRTGKHPAVRGHRRRLYEITRLDCFADAANWKPRERSARKIGEEAAVPVLAELVVRCGLATREIRQIRTSQIKDNGILLSRGRFIPFGDKWEEVSRASLHSWLTRANPTDYLFFSRKPVDRHRPVSSVWIARTLKGAGFLLQQRRSARLRHFAGDFARLGSGKRFTDHVKRIHGLSRSGSREALELLRQRKARSSTALHDPEIAFDALFPQQKARGRKPKGIYAEAKQLHEREHLSWPKIAQRLDPKAYGDDPRKAAEAVRQGVLRMRTKISK